MIKQSSFNSIEFLQFQRVTIKFVSIMHLRHSGSTQLSDFVGGGRRGTNYPFQQPNSLSNALLERQLELLGSLLAVVEEANQVQILDVMLNAAKGPPSKPGLKEDPIWRNASLTTICSTALAGLDSLARQFRGKIFSSRRTILLTLEFKDLFIITHLASKGKWLEKLKLWARFAF